MKKQINGDVEKDDNMNWYYRNSEGLRMIYMRIKWKIIARYLNLCADIREWKRIYSGYYQNPDNF